MINDWYPARVSKEYKKNYEQINWPEQKNSIPTTQELPFCCRCEGECKVLKQVGDTYSPDLYECSACGWRVYDEPDRIDWKKITVEYCPSCNNPIDPDFGPLCSCLEDAQDILEEGRLKLRKILGTEPMGLLK